MTDYGDSSLANEPAAAAPRDDDRVADAAIKPAPGIAVRVWLFGALAGLSAERPLALALPSGTTAGDVVDAIGERLGRPFLDLVMAEPGEMFRCCRFFADGHPVTSLDEKLAPEGKAVEIEMLLLMGYEGG